MTPDLRLVHLYPDLLRTYGDRGNILTLQRRAEWRGFRVDVVKVSLGERLPERANLIFIGGGSDRVQQIISSDLNSRLNELRDAMAERSVILGVCGGYQLLGHSYVSADGTEIDGLGLLDARTTSGTGRIIGDVVANARLDQRTFELVGFENHGGRTHLGANARPLATVVAGRGNNGSDREEGAVQDNIVGTYLHGPVLPPNPDFADALLERALEPLTGGDRLPPLDDGLERTAHRYKTERRR